MLCTYGGMQDFVKVSGSLGLAKLAALAAWNRGLTARRGFDAVMGTVGFMSPEAMVGQVRCRGLPQRRLSPLGAVAYFLLTGAEAFGGESLLETAAQHLNPQLQASPPSASSSAVR